MRKFNVNEIQFGIDRMDQQLKAKVPVMARDPDNWLSQGQRMMQVFFLFWTIGNSDCLICESLLALPIHGLEWHPLKIDLLIVMERPFHPLANPEKKHSFEAFPLL